MRKIISTTFITLDGVMQAPGGPEEDKSNGFAYGGWQFGKYEDDIAAKIFNNFTSNPFELLLGRRTYDIFASYWPNYPDEPNFGKPFNTTKKYVVSHQSPQLSWDNSKLITGDVVTEIKRLKTLDAPDMWIWGSGNLIQTLLNHNLIDRMHILTYPITIGNGKKLFAEGTQPNLFKMIDSKVTTTGVMFATYEPTGSLKTESI